MDSSSNAPRKRKTPPFFNLLKVLRRKYPNLSCTEVAKLGGNIWRKMSSEEKLKYEKKARRGTNRRCRNR
ncbi:unnamed protein product [Nezara viridula]|uniref:HMG box domain-containing protein n=1 Tax=Nezara viridula TaxID=85310 RepID=A0A9P0MPT8_NEZVI|nr:unnamed protein product [Nezara viridula]